MTAAVAAAHDVHDHHDEEHPPEVVWSSRMPIGLMGMLFFIGSEAALFCSFFMSYFFVRVAQIADYSSWAEALGHAVPVDIATLNSLILFSSSVTIHWAEIALKRNQRGWLKAMLAATIVLGAIFLSIQIKEYATLVHHDKIGPSTNAYSSVFFSITGLHGSHVLVGLILLTIMLVRTLRGHYGPRHDQHVGFHTMGVYWHFVDLVWVFVFGLIYLPGNIEHVNWLLLGGGIAVLIVLTMLGSKVIPGTDLSHGDGGDDAGGAPATAH